MRSPANEPDSGSAYAADTEPSPLPGGGQAAAKRRAIEEAAIAVFLRDGYHGASMDEIAAVAGVSKPTVYRRYSDKEKLFGDIVRVLMDRLDTSMRSSAFTIDASSGPRDYLRELGRRILTGLLDPDVLRLRRLAIGESGRFPELGRVYYEEGFRKGLTTVAQAIQRMIQQGWLRDVDPYCAAGHFAGLVLWVPVNQALLCDGERLTSAAITEYIDTGVDAFLAAYQPG